MLRTCKKCKNTYICIETEQKPGYKWKEEEICPYCENVNRTSMEYCFETYKYKRADYGKRTK